MITYRQPFRGEYPITQQFGEVIEGVTFGDKPHTGIDYACPAGTPVLASEVGKVMFAGWRDGGYGYCVFLNHSDGMTTIYEHLLRNIPVTVGQTVYRGQVIGYSGSTGNSTGPHLHFEMRDLYGKAIDPMNVLHTVIDLPQVTGKLDHEGSGQDPEESPSELQVTGKLEPGIYRVVCDSAFVRDWEKLSRQKLVYKGEPVYVFGELKWLDDLPFYFIGAGYAMAAYDVDGTIILEKVKDGEEE